MLPFATGSRSIKRYRTKAGLEIRKIADEYFTFIEECDGAKACTILLRGASKDVLNEIERNLQDALQVAE